MEFNKKNTKKILLLITFGIFLYWGLQNLEKIGEAMSFLYQLLFPFILGLVMAFVINIPMSVIEKKFFKERKKKKAARTIQLPFTIKRVLSLSISIVLLVGFLILVIAVVIPELINVISTISGKVPEMLTQAQEFVLKLFENYPDLNNQIQNIGFDMKNINGELVKVLQEWGGNLFNTSINVIMGIIGGVTNTTVGFIFAIYLLMQKEKLFSQIKKVAKAYIPEKKVERISNILTVSNEQFNKFLTGQFIEALILGSLCAIGMFILGLPYAVTIGILIAFTALIPIIGAFIGLIIGAILIAFVSPMKALIFIVFLLILQQIEGNVIYPKVVGNQVGLPGIWVLVAITIGSSLMGIIGIMISVPICSIIYILLKKDVSLRLEEKDNTIIKEE